jgi:MFS family permease
MLVEMTLVQKFILFLGRPVYALSIVLFSTLLFGGLGSFCSARLSNERLRRNISLICLVISAVTLAYVPLLTFFLYRLVGLPTLLKALLSIGFLAPLGFVMGMPMPLGISWLRRTAPALIPWAWGINGAASVLGSILTMMIAVNLGFNQALIVAVGLYISAIVFLFCDVAFRDSRRQADPTSVGPAIRN